MPAPISRIGFRSEPTEDRSAWWRDLTVDRFDAHGPADLVAGHFRADLMARAVRDGGIVHNVWQRVTGAIARESAESWITDHGGRVFARWPVDSTNGDGVFGLWDDGVLCIINDGQVGPPSIGASSPAGADINCVTLDESFSRTVAEWARSISPKSDKRLHALALNSDGTLSLRALRGVASPLIRENYSTDVLAAFDKIVADLESKTPRGRIAILDGPPGTGKTHMLRGIMHAADGVFVVVPPKLVARLGDPEMIVPLAESTRGTLVFLLEDADQLLSARTGANLSDIASLLNLGDGLLGQSINARIVATTNAPAESIDAAVMRPGRLSERVTIGQLDAAHADRVCRRLCGRGLNTPRPMTLAEVYAQAREESAA